MQTLMCVCMHVHVRALVIYSVCTHAIIDNNIVCACIMNALDHECRTLTTTCMIMTHMHVEHGSPLFNIKSIELHTLHLNIMEYGTVQVSYI